MDQNAGLIELKNLFRSEPEAPVTVVLATNEAEVLQRLNLTDELANHFRDTACSALLERFYSSTKVVYEPGYKPDDYEVAVIDLGDSNLGEFVENVADVGPLELFAADNDVIDGLRFYAVVVDFDQDRKAVFFRTCSSKIELSRRPGFAALMQDGQYNRFKERILLFDETVDCLAWSGQLYIANVYNFQRLFGYFDELRKEADRILESVMQQIPISNDDEFRTACRGLQMVSKLNQIARKPYFGSITMDDIERTIAHCNLPVTVIEVEGVRKLVFETSLQKRWLILKLLDDDFLDSTMTGRMYATNSKSSLVS